MKISSLEPSLLKEGSPTAPDFTIYTGAMEVDSEHENVVRMIGSSTEQDLHGDTMAISALTDMTMVEPGLLIWLNHDYTLPGSLFGSLLEKPELRLQGGIADIHIASDVETTNPDAVQTYGYLKRGRRVGCSIGCMILEAEIDKDNDDGYSWWPPLIINHVQTLEWSIVGIPANQRCWPETAAKGLFNRMLSQGRGDEALALAPMVKGLYPKAYENYLKSVDDSALRRDLERVEVKASPKQRVEWVPNERMFVMNQKGVYKPLKRDEVTAILAKSAEKPQPVQKTEAQNTLTTPEVEKALQGALEKRSGVWDTLKGASGKTSWPLADEGTKWDNGEAHKRIKDKFGGDDPDWAKVKSVHFWYDPEKAETWDGYKLLFADGIDDEVKAVPNAIYACAGAVDGARAKLDIPDEDVPPVKKKIEKYYHRLDKDAPWEDGDKEEGIEPGKESAMDPKTKVKDTTGSAAASETIAASFREGDTVTLAGTGELATVKSVDDQGRVTVAPYKETEEETEIHTLKSGEGALVIKSAEDTTLAKIPLVENPASPLDLQLFNALAVRFGQPQLILDASGQIQATKAFPELTPEAIQEAIAATLNFGETVKSGSQFSKKNQQTLQSLHNSIVDMCKSQFHPCEEMAGDDEEDNPDDGDEQKQFSAELLTANSEIPALREDFKALIDTLKSQGHLVDPKAIKDMQSRVDAADKRLKDIQATTKTAEERLANLQNAPLGQPTLLKRGIQNNGDIVTHEDFKALSALTMGDNEKRWSLDEALRETIVVPRTLASGEAMNYRKWPEGVGGTVKDGVRPALTSGQREWMHPADALAYKDGEEALVPCYDDPLNVEA